MRSNGEPPLSGSAADPLPFGPVIDRSRKPSLRNASSGAERLPGSAVPLWPFVSPYQLQQLQQLSNMGVISRTQPA
jgi:hypothetical protein